MGHLLVSWYHYRYIAELKNGLFNNFFVTLYWQARRAQTVSTVRNMMTPSILQPYKCVSRLMVRVASESLFEQLDGTWNGGKVYLTRNYHSILSQVQARNSQMVG